MEEVVRLLRETLFSQYAIAWAVAFTAFLAFLGTLVAAWGLSLIRGTKASVEKAKQDSERLSYYLFGKLGPIDTK